MKASIAKTTIATVFAGTAKAAIKHHYYHPHQTKIQYNLIIIMDLNFTFKSRLLGIQCITLPYYHY